MSRHNEVDPTFPTLRAVGYTRCDHPRVRGNNCCDCGAVNHLGHWVGGHLEFRRLPYVLEDARP